MGILNKCKRCGAKYEMSNFFETPNEKNNVKLCKDCEEVERRRSMLKGKPWDYNMITGWSPPTPPQVKIIRSEYIIDKNI